MSIDNLKSVVEGLIFASDQPSSLDRLFGLFDEDAPTREQLKAAVHALQADYADRGIALVELASGYQFRVKRELSPWLQKLWEERPPKYTRALLETLALIAYRQPVTRGEIEEVRGVAVSSNIIRTLVEREWVRVVGHKDVPGKPAMYATTRQFLDYFNLKNLSELPSLSALTDIDDAGEQLEIELQQASLAHAPEDDPMPTEQDARLEEQVPAATVAMEAAVEVETNE